MRRLLPLLTIMLLTFGGFASVSAHGDNDDTNDSGYQYDRDGGDRYDRNRDDRNRDGDRQEGDAVSYINPDTGAATENPDVDPNSDCFNPDQYDDQRLSDSGTANRNVHNDACFLDDRGDKVDGLASFQSFGVGFISACPDPDGAGPKVAILSDTDGDGRNDLCFQSGYQEKGMAGDFEFHARLNNTATPGEQNVVWCSDADRNGCTDERNTSDITINWTR